MNSYCFKFGNYIFPDTYIAEGGYKCTPNQRQDLDPYTDQFGVTQRNALAHTKTQVDITTRAGLKWEEVNDIVDGLTSNYTNPRERDATCEYFDTEYFTMSGGHHMYLDPSFATQIRQMDKNFEALTFTFIEY